MPAFAFGLLEDGPAEPNDRPIPVHFTQPCGIRRVQPVSYLGFTAGQLHKHPLRIEPITKQSPVHRNCATTSARGDGGPYVQ